MIFAIQRYLEDYFSSTRWADRDQYAISLANLYDRERLAVSEEQFLARMRAIRTGFFRTNGLDRGEVEGKLLSRLDGRFKKNSTPTPARRPSPRSSARSLVSGTGSAGRSVTRSASFLNTTCTPSSATRSRCSGTRARRAH